MNSLLPDQIPGPVRSVLSIVTGRESLESASGYGFSHHLSPENLYLEC